MGRSNSASRRAAIDPHGATSERPGGSSLAERLREERGRAFVGRVEETALYERLLADDSQSLLFISGQAGVGKSALLQELERLTLEAGHACARIDAGSFASNTAQARALLREQLTPLLEPDPAHDRERGVLLVDGLEAERSGHDWLLDELEGALPRDSLLVLASRREVPQRWALDPAWSGLMVRCKLPPLGEPEARRFLTLRGVPADNQGAILEHAAGFPLALALAADVSRRNPQRGFTLAALQDVQHALARLLCVRPVSPGQQLALDVCSMARATTAELLDGVASRLGKPLDGEPQDAFAWLEDQSFIEWTPAGLRPHYLSRLALKAQLRRERPRRSRAIAAALREFSVAELEAGSRPESDLANLFYLDRDVPKVRRWTPPLETSLQPIEPARSSDHHAIVELIRATEGSEAAKLTAACLQRPGDIFEVVRGDGLSGLLHLTRFDVTDGPEKLLQSDPVSAPLRGFMRDHPLGEQEESFLVRSFLDREDYQTPSARVLALTGRLSQLVLSGKQLPYSFCVFRKPEDWEPIWKDIELPWRELSRFTLGAHQYSLIVFMWKRRTLREVLLQAWQEPKPSDAAKSAAPSLDELRLKVTERIERLAPQLKLTPREREILEQLCLGDSLEDIARTLSIRPRTVKFHQENLLRKTGANSRAELFKKLL